MELKIKKQKRLSVEELKKFKGLEKITEIEAEEIITTLEDLSILFYSLYKKQSALIEKTKEHGQGENNYEFRQAA